VRAPLRFPRSSSERARIDLEGGFFRAAIASRSVFRAAPIVRTRFT
jgi:hypothetical protein